MPSIEYTCQDCSHEFRAVVLRGEEDAPARCPKCHSRRVRRAVSAKSLFDGIAGFSDLARDTN